MRFSFAATARETRITALFESDDRYEAVRAEGTDKRMILHDNTAIFEYPVKDIHPDLLGQICMILFRPFIGSAVTFPRDVSPALRTAYGRPGFDPIEIRNVREDLPGYAGRGMCVSFGGGIDSSCIRALFPEALVVHENAFKVKHLCGLRFRRRRRSAIRKTVESLGTRGLNLYTNQKYLSRPAGWHSWVASMATSTLIATDYGIGAVLMGSNLGSTYLMNGKGFHDRNDPERLQRNGPSGNEWQSTFYDIGLPAFSPVAGISEVANARIAYGVFADRDIHYCKQVDVNGCRGRCPKCFRRALIRTALGQVGNIDWDGFRNPRVRKLLADKPLYFGHVYSYCIRRIAGLPAWITDAVGDLPDTAWVERYFPPALDLIPERYRRTVRGRMERFLSPMSPEERKTVRAWSGGGSGETTDGDAS